MEMFFPMLGILLVLLIASAAAIIIAVGIVAVLRILRKSWPLSIGMSVAWLVVWVVGMVGLWHVFGGILSVLAAPDHVTRDVVIGSYKADYRQWTEILVLSENDTYRQVCVSNTGQVIQHTGRWEFSDNERGSVVCLAKPLEVDDAGADQNVVPANGSISFPVGKFLGCISLPIDYDLGYRYDKITGPGAGWF